MAASSGLGGNIGVSLADPKARNFINLGEFPTFSDKGHFQIRGVTPGRYLVQFSSCANGHDATQRYPAVKDVSQAQAITVRSGRTTPASDRDFNLGGSISGLEALLEDHVDLADRFVDLPGAGPAAREHGRVPRPRSP